MRTALISFLFMFGLLLLFLPSYQAVAVAAASTLYFHLVDKL